ncbi:hypothetical protein BGZ65_008429, partial [Modicella reniformis]
GMDILERNQVVWCEAGGRNSIDDDDDDVDDRHLKRNQALFESLRIDDAAHQKTSE